MSARPRHAPSWRAVRNPRICSGEPTIGGTRVPVSSIVNLWLYYRDIDRVLSAFPSLDRDAIACALDYYQQHQEEIERLIAEGERDAYATR